MKRLFNLVALFLIFCSASAQTAKAYQFRNPSKSGSTYTFLSVASGVDAIVTISGSKNATVDKMDDSSIYAYAWQPNIKYTNKTTNANDSSYVEFTINFVKRTNGTADIQSALAMTIIDCDGPGNSNTFREFVRTSMPATPKAIANSTITAASDSKWLYFKSGTAQFNNIDTTNYAAMVQVNYTSISTFKMRVGVLGAIGAGDTRQASFYFKGFSAMVVALPVTLNLFTADLKSSNANLTWSTASEENLSKFEVMRSFDGHNYQTIGSINATGNSNEINSYQFTDMNVADFNQSHVYYQLKMVDEKGSFRLSNITQLKMAEKITANVSVYPNPSSDVLNLTLNTTPDSEVNVVITDVNGKAVQQYLNPEMNGNTMTFDIRNLENGIYFIKVLNNDGSATSNKFIKR